MPAAIKQNEVEMNEMVRKISLTKSKKKKDDDESSEPDEFDETDEAQRKR